MRILIVSQYFWPENFLINNLAVGLVERGHRVTVLTGSPNYPQGSFFEGYGFFNRSEDYHGVRVVRVPLLPRGGGGGLRLALNYLSFAACASLAGPLLCRGGHDLVFVFEPSPITVGIPALILRKLLRAPLLFWVQDLWPESLSATGALRSPRLLAQVGRMVRQIYRRCDLILVQSRAFTDSVVDQGADPGRIRYFPNSAEKVFAGPAPSCPVQPALPDGFRVVFAGNIGAAQDFETIIAAAEELKGYRDIQWIIIGDGRMREWAQARVLALGLGGNFHFLGRHPVEAMPAFFSAADVLLVTLKKQKIFALTIPSKVQAYLACGKPVIAALDGEGARIVAEAGAGLSCPAEDPAAFARTVLEMYQTPKAGRDRMGVNGKAYYRANFDRDLLLDRLVLWMKELSDANSRGAQP
jgi:colanic acid biosynthesis glycosyl transferase WcaI